MTAAVRKPEAADLDFHSALDSIENLRTIQRTMSALLAATADEQPEGIRGDLASTLYTLRTLADDGAFDPDLVASARRAVEDSLTPSDDLHTVDRDCMAAMFDLMDCMLSQVESTLRPPPVAPLRKPRSTPQADNVVRPLFSDSPEGK